MNIVSLFISAAQLYPERIALTGREQDISYRALHEEVIATAAYFREKGINPGDRVLVFVPISNDLYRTVLALFYVGATAVFLDGWVSKERMELCCRIAKCKGLIATPKIRLLSFLSKELRKIPVKLTLSGRSKENKANLFYEPKQDDTALITFTTGSTGIPKAANRTHAFLKYQFEALVPLLNPVITEIDLTTLPIVLLLNLGIGKTSVIPDFNSQKPEKFNPVTLIFQIKKYPISALTSSPYYLVTLSNYLLEHKIVLPSVRKLFTGGAPVFPSEAFLLQKAFPEAEIIIVYGSTEAEPISHINALDLIAREKKCAEMKGLSVGHVNASIVNVKILTITSQEIKVENEQTLETYFLSENNIGEICVSGNHVLRNYIDNPEAVKMNKILVGDTVWHRTGDAGFLSGTGELFLLGRCKQIIHWNGNVYYPFLVEYFCKSQTGVSMGTLVFIEQPLLVIEVTIDFNSVLFQKTAAEYGLNFPVKVIRKIPRDPRHFSKIDYDTLTNLLSK